MDKQNKVYSLPTFAIPTNFHALENPDNSVSFNKMIQIFDAVMACYPTYSRFDDNVKGNMLVYGIPITPTERDDRLIQQEAQTRTAIIENIGTFMQAVEMKKQAGRQITLYRSLESRSQERVKRGLAPMTEQIGFMDKVVNSYSHYHDWSVKVITAGAAIISHCQNADRANVEAILKEYVLSNGLITY